MEKFHEPPPPYVVNIPGSAPSPVVISVPHGAGPNEMPVAGNFGHGSTPGYVVIENGQPIGQPIQATIVIAQGNCPNCGTGFLVERYTTCGIICLICFFPLGIICCMLMKETKCGACGYAK